MTDIQTRIRMTVGGLAATALMAFGTSVAGAQVIDLEGQTVTIVHNAAPGGSTGLGAQITADAWSKYMAGNPTMVVQSVEGGALSRGILQVMNSRPNGLTLGWLAWTGTTRILDPEELRIPFDDFALIGGVGGPNFLVHVSANLAGGLESADDFVNVENFTFGGFNPRSASTMRMAGALDLLGIDWQYVSGFSGDAPLQAALQRGEVDGYPATNVVYNQQLRDGMIADGESLGAFYFTPVGEDGNMVEDALMPELEPFDAYYRRVKGEDPSGPAWEMMKFHGEYTDPVIWLVVAPPGTPDEHLQMLRDSFAQAVQDETFMQDAERLFGIQPTISVGEEIEQIVQNVQNTDEEMRGIMLEYIQRMER